MAQESPFTSQTSDQKVQRTSTEWLLAALVDSWRSTPSSTKSSDVGDSIVTVRLLLIVTGTIATLLSSSIMIVLAYRGLNAASTLIQM